MAALAGSGTKIGHHQLFFDRMSPRTGAGPAAGVSRRPRRVLFPEAAWVQLDLLTPPARPGRCPPASPSLTAAIRAADGIAEAHGWSGEIRRRVRHGLAIALAGHREGEDVRWSRVLPPPRAGHLYAGHVAEVLRQMGVLHDDRRPAFDAWLDRKLDGMTGGIRRDVERWLRTLKNGGPRSIATVHSHLGKALPALSGWSARYHHLREVTPEDIEAHLRGLHGSQRHNALVALRSLFGFCLTAGVVFRKPCPRRQGRQAARHHRDPAAGPRRHRRRHRRRHHTGGPAQLADAYRLIAELTAQVERLSARVEELERQVRRDSSTSSRLPSSDSPYRRKGGDRSLRERGKRRPGKQPGDPGSTMSLVDDPDERIECPPAACRGCGADLAGVPVTAWRRHQVTGIAPAPKVTEYVAQAKECAGCGTVTAGELPAHVRARASYGPGTCAQAANLVSGHYIPIHRATVLLCQMAGIAVSTGWMAGIRGKAAALVEASGFMDRVRELLKSAPALHADETPARAASARRPPACPPSSPQPAGTMRWPTWPAAAS